MQKRIWTVLLLVVLAALVAGCGVLQEPEAASGQIEAIPLEVETAVVEPAATDTAVLETTEAGSEAVTVEATAVPTEVAPAPAEEETAGTTADTATGEVRIYRISQAESQVRFELDEDLRGQRQTVIGVTDQVAGEIAFNLSDLSSAQVGVLQVNVRTVTTDNNFRNRAIQNEILETGSYEFITFTPTAINGLLASANLGEAITFTVEGDLTIRDITQPVTFTVVATPVTETQLVGTASAVISRADYNLNIPSVPNVANVEEEVELYIDFVANA